MVAAAKKQGIVIQYETVYKTLAVQQKDFYARNSKTPTNISKSSSIPEVKNGRFYSGSKWYPSTITNYNPLPGFNIFGTGLCIRIKNNNEKVINFIKTNGSNYGWSWSSDVPLTDPDFQNILVYYAAGIKPSKYRDRTGELEIFKPVSPVVTFPTDPTVGIVPRTVIPVRPIGTSPWDENIVPKLNGPTILVVNSTSLVGYAGRLATTLNYIGLKGPEIITRKTINKFIPGIGDVPNVGLYTNINELYTYIWGIRKEIFNKNKTVSIPEYLEATLNSHEQTPGHRVYEKLQNVNAVNHIDLMSYINPGPGKELQSFSPLGIEKFDGGNRLQTSIIYYLPENEKYVKENLVPLLDKLNGRILDTDNFEVQKKSTPYSYVLKKAPNQLATLMRKGNTVIFYDLDYIFNKLSTREFTFNNSYYSIRPGYSFPAASTLGRSQSANIIDVFTRIEKWPSGVATPDNGPATNWALVTRLDKKVYPVKTTIATISPFNIMIILGKNTVLKTEEFVQQIRGFPRWDVPGWLGILPLIGNEQGIIGGYLDSTVLEERKKIDEILKNPNTKKDIPSTTVPSTTIPKSPSTTIAPSPVRPSTTTIAPSTTTPSTVAPSRPTVVVPKVRPDNPRYNPAPVVPKQVPVTNPIPLIIGDSIALGVANAYENESGNESNNIVPNIFSGVTDPTKWDGKFQRQGENLKGVFNRMTKALTYLSTKNQARNRIVWLSTGTANSIGQTYAAQGKKSDMTSWIIKQFDLLKSYNATVTVIGISSDQDNLYSYYMNNYMEDLCKKYKYRFIKFRAGGDDVHPPSYGPILEELIPDLPTDVEVIPPVTTVPGSTTSIPTTTVPGATTTIPSTGTTTRTWVPAPPGARPGAGAAGIGAPRPIVAPTTTVPSTSTPSTTVPRQQSTTTTVVGSNGVTTTTTIVFPPKIPVLPPYTPGTTTTTTPNGVTTTTVVASNGVTTTTIVIPPTIEGGGSTSSTTSIPPTTSTTVVSPGTTIPPRPRDPDYNNPPPSVPVPKLNSFDIISLTAENDPNRTNIDVSIVLNFDQEMVRNVGTVIFYKKNTTKALAKVGINSAEIDFVDSKTISITPKNVLPYDTEVSVIFPANIFKSKANKSWGGNPGNHNYISFTTIKDPNLTSPDVPAPKPKPKPKDPEIPEVPIISPPIESGPVVMPEKPKPIADPVENEKNLQSNDGLWKRGVDFVDAKITSLKQDVQIVQIAPHTSWVFEFNVLDDAGVIKNIGRIGLERDVPKCVGDEVSPFVCFFTMYGGFKAAPDTLVDRYRQAPCANPVSDYGPGMTLRNKLIWRVKDTFEFRVSYVSAEAQEYVVKTLCTSTTRPIDPAVGDTIYESDTDDIYVWTGLAWMQLADATLNIAQGKTFENPNTFIVNGTWWSGMIWNKTLRRTYPLGNIFVPSNYTNIDATKDYVKYSGPESGKTNTSERKASSNFTNPLGFNAEGLRGRYEEQ